MKEKEFLKLAGFYLLARWQMLGNQTNSWRGKTSTGGADYLTMSLMGMQDSAYEMALICQEIRADSSKPRAQELLSS